ncbi:MAG TPA: photosystem II reaction center protein Psb28 [Leptolyngbyaceae cyanobacterium M33_DOE_097]|uniref:Photosystem II reaction center Psb28 protein n=1 Tax=Oscillatoriales cyanobacterium SpSt-418 TaxID=2282169 RepID=A0A7C3PMH0_9CYAN|nr:photosystem II reaction center protein Psb28 [Leptolyngbyaceae cyanobacterium M33_DOE_097]
MANVLPTIQFFEGLYEEIDSVSLRLNRSTGTKIVVLTFRQLKSIEQFNSFRNRFSKVMKLTDEEGEIQVEPSSIKFFFGGDEGDELDHVDCAFEIDREDHWQRVQRFMDRYAEANGMAFGKKDEK